MATDGTAAPIAPLIVPAFNMKPGPTITPPSTGDLVSSMNAAVQRLKQQALDMVTAETAKMQQSLNEAMAAAGQPPTGFP